MLGGEGWWGGRRGTGGGVVGWVVTPSPACSTWWTTTVGLDSFRITGLQENGLDVRARPFVENCCLAERLMVIKKGEQVHVKDTCIVENGPAPVPRSSRGFALSGFRPGVGPTRLTVVLH